MQQSLSTDFSPSFYLLLDRSITKWNSHSRNRTDLKAECVIRCLEIYKQNSWTLSDDQYLPYAQIIFRTKIMSADYKLTTQFNWGYQKFTLIQKIRNMLASETPEEQIRIDLRLTPERYEILKKLTPLLDGEKQQIIFENIPARSYNEDFRDALSPTEQKIADLILANYSRREIRDKTQIGYRKLNRIYRRIGRKIKQDLAGA